MSDTQTQVYYVLESHFYTLLLTFAVRRCVHNVCMKVFSIAADLLPFDLLAMKSAN
jgi:hypothetical protein